MKFGQKHSPMPWFNYTQHLKFNISTVIHIHMKPEPFPKATTTFGKASCLVISELILLLQKCHTQVWSLSKRKS